MRALVVVAGGGDEKSSLWASAVLFLNVVV